MKIRIYTEEAWESYPHITCGCWGECRSPKWVTVDDVKGLLERAALPGDGDEAYIVASEETVKRCIAEEEERLKKRAVGGPSREPIIYTLKGRDGIR